MEERARKGEESLWLVILIPNSPRPAPASIATEIVSGSHRLSESAARTKATRLLCHTWRCVAAIPQDSRTHRIDGLHQLDRIGLGEAPHEVARCRPPQDHFCA